MVDMQLVCSWAAVRSARLRSIVGNLWHRVVDLDAGRAEILAFLGDRGGAKSAWNRITTTPPEKQIVNSGKAGRR
jgi:hypothetical protein